MKARFAIGGIISYQLLLILLIFLRPDLDPSWHTISEWAIGPYGWLMSCGFVISGLSYAALWWTIRSEVCGSGKAGSALLLVCVIGAVGVGFCTTDPMPIRPPLSVRGTLHVIFGTAQLMMLPFAALLINLNLARKNAAWRRSRRVLLATAFVPMFGFLCFVLYSAVFVAPKGTDAYGPGVNIGWPPRFAFFTYMIWVIAVASERLRITAEAKAALTSIPGSFGTMSATPYPPPASPSRSIG